MIKDKIKNIIGNIEKNHISEYSAQCAYFIILSFIPFIILLLTTIQYLGLDENTLFDIISSIAPNAISDKVLDIIQEVYSKSLGTVSISIIFIIWSAGKGIFALCKGLNAIYKVQKKYNYFSLKLRAFICTIGFLAVIIITLIILVFGNKINIRINQNFQELGRITNAILYFGKFVIFLILFLVFLLIYKFIPKHKVRISKQVPGALMATAGWIIISYLFSIYLDIFTGFSVMYGSLTAVMLLFMWIYLCIYMLLLGAALNKHLEKFEIKKGEKNEEKN